MKNYLFALLFFVLSFVASASHIVGGEVYYDSLGNDQYRITFEVYRDCSGAAYDSPLYFTVFHANGVQFNEFSIPLPIPDTLPIIYDDPCVTPPTDICIQRAIYTGIFTLPATPDGYYISYQRCCWAANIQNIVNPGSWGITITTQIPGTNLVSNLDNNSARFNEYPPIVLCSGQTLDFDHSAFDQDGDSLVYSLCDPLTVNNTVSEPNPENAGPYTPVPWEPGFSGTVPFGTGSNITINPQTGFMNITPGVTGTYVASVCVEEWRDGVLINTKSRTFGYRVVVCDVIEPMQVDVLGLGTLIEDCGSTGFIVTREDTTTAITLQIFLSGTAINGEDYNFLPDTIIMPVGVATDTISITPYLDDVTEGNETLIFNIVVENICNGTYDTTTAFVTIQDYYSMGIVWEDSLNLCDETGENGLLWCSVTNGIPPYFYYWEPLPSVDNDTLIFSSTVLNENLNMMYVTVYDQCGKAVGPAPIKVYNRCPVIAPNVITPNGDGINDQFLVTNLGDYDKVELIIINRWGNLIYENDNYLNDWSGKDKSGKDLEEGVYFYTVIPESTKYIYDDDKKTEYTVHGFFHIIRD